MNTNQSIRNCNSATNLQCSQPPKYRRIHPKELVFLVSNPMATSYIQKSNVQQNPLTEGPQFNTAYESCEQAIVEHTKMEEDQAQCMDRMQKKINRRIHSFNNNKSEQQETIDNYLMKISFMDEEMYSKAGDIMHGNNNSTFSRDALDMSIKELKNQKTYSACGSLKKLESTRHFMLQTTRRLKEGTTTKKQTDHQTSSIMDNSMKGASTNSTLDNTLLNQISAEQEHTNQRQKLLKKLVTKSFQDIFESQRRNSAKKAFGHFWKLGGTNKKINREQLFAKGQKPNQNGTQIKKKSHCYQPNNRDTLLNEVFENQCRLAGNKRYSECFDKAVKGLALIGT